ncbi:sphingosine hydroxylase [Amylocystis lapponica]|nr:sphingosine hydroxylase [Amylocystis lapponica]
MNLTDASALFSPQQLHFLSTNTPVYYSPRPALISWLPDHFAALAAPVAAYWVLSLIFHAVDVSGCLDKYRIHDSAEVASRNLVSRGQVIRAVIFQQIVQTVLGYWWMEESVSGAGVDHLDAMLRRAPSLLRFLQWTLGEEIAGRVLETDGQLLLYALYWWAIPVAKFFFGMFIIDTWQYCLHRSMHMNTFLYKKLHSVHHRLYVPYAFGALYNHPIEGFFLDTLGAVIAEALANMSTREAILLFTVSTLKTVDDHCGYKIPWDPLQFFSSNNADYHDIHHQIIGIKSNFSQPFFIHWDAILGTRMTRQDIALRRSKQQQKAE